MPETTATANQPLPPVDMKRAREVLQLARTITLTRAPYIGPMLSKLIVFWAPGLGTFGVTERGHLLIDPRAMLAWEADEGVEVIAGVLFHEVMHVVLKHAARLNGRTHRRWNVAADLFINGNAVECGFRLPSCGVFPETTEHATGKAPFAVPTPWKCADGSTVTMPAGLTADEYYDRLPTPPQDDGDGGQGQGEGQGGEAGDGAPQRADGNEGGPADGNCGSGAGGEPFEGEPEADTLDEDGNAVGERAQGELDQAADAVARQAQEHAKAQGNLSAGFRVWADAATRPPEVPWERKLRRAGRAVTDKLGRGRQTYRRPHRRAICMGAHPRNPLMAIHEQTLCRVWFVIDTSGSMSHADHIAAISELMGVVRNGGEVYILACDSAVQGEPVKLPRSMSATKRLLHDLLKGGGGTDFRPAFEAAEKCPPRQRPDLIVFATDGYGPAPATATVPTIWLITPGGKVPAAYGEAIHVSKVA